MAPANTGMTAIINPHGAIEAAAAEYTRTVLTRTVAGMRGATPYVRWGNLAALALCLFIIGVVVFIKRHTQKTTAD